MKNMENYIIGKKRDFSYYYALFLKKLEKDNAFEDFIKIINNKPNNEVIFTIIYTLYYALPYFHKQYLIENIHIFKSCIINYISNLDDKEIIKL